MKRIFPGAVIPVPPHRFCFIHHDISSQLVFSACSTLKNHIRNPCLSSNLRSCPALSSGRHTQSAIEKSMNPVSARARPRRSRKFDRNLYEAHSEPHLPRFSLVSEEHH